MEETTTPKLTDAGREYVRKMRIIFLPVRVALVLFLVTWPAGGPIVAWSLPSLRAFLVGLVLTVVLERTGITMDPSTKSRDRFSKAALTASLFGAMMVGVWQAASGQGVVGDALLGMQVLGGLLWGTGETIRRWAMQTLGRFFTDTVRIFQDHKLIIEGPYKLVRHPSYAGLFLVMIGAPMTTGSLVAVVVSTIAGGAALAWRVTVEERELRGAFGAAYEAYRASTPALMPWPRPAARA